MEFGGALTMFFMFDVEMVIFSALNVWQPVTNHWILALSFTVSMIYMSMIILSIPMVFMLANRPKELLEDEVYKSDFEAVYEGYRLDDGISKYFKAFSIIRFLFFGLVLVFMYYLPLIQISGSFLIALTYLVMLYMIKPHEERREYIIELITEVLFTSGNICFLLLGLDDAYGLYDINVRVFIGWVLFVIYVVALIISIVVCVMEIIETINNIIEYCKNKKKSKDTTKDKAKTDKSKSEISKSSLKNSQLRKLSEDISLSKNANNIRSSHRDINKNLSTDRIALNPGEKDDAIKKEEESRAKSSREVKNFLREQDKAKEKQKEVLEKEMELQEKRNKLNLMK
jgi:hypothetical protein